MSRLCQCLKDCVVYRIYNRPASEFEIVHLHLIRRVRTCSDIWANNVAGWKETACASSDPHSYHTWSTREAKLKSFWHQPSVVALREILKPSSNLSFAEGSIALRLGGNEYNWVERQYQTTKAGLWHGANPGISGENETVNGWRIRAIDFPDRWDVRHQARFYSCSTAGPRRPWNLASRKLIHPTNDADGWTSKVCFFCYWNKPPHRIPSQLVPNKAQLHR